MKVVIALGGNALGNDPYEQLELVKKTSKTIVDLVEEGANIVITHGNGPQVGMINQAMDYSSNNGSGTPNMPFAECGAMSQGYIGYHLQQAIQNELNERKIDKECVTIVTQVEVDPHDPAFSNPTKPIGRFYSRKDARALAKEHGYVMKEDAHRGYRRVVPSPIPKKIVELETIESLVNDGKIVITCGGGGIPVIKQDESYVGVDAVIDKDNSSARLAIDLEADQLMILTAVDKVCLNYHEEDEIPLKELSVRQAQKYIKANQFAQGSMLPKIEACLKYVNETGHSALITSLLKAKDGLKGEEGTLIKKVLKDKKQDRKTRRLGFGLTSFSIIFIMIIILGLITHFLPPAKFVEDTIVDGSGVVAAKLSDVLMSPFSGFASAIEVCIFVFILGGFLAIVNKTNALMDGIKVLVGKLKGKELVLIPILMLLFSIGGTTYGMLEETVVFYALLAFVMVASGMDTIVSSATILLGAGSGVLGSTINPFATGAAIDALADGMTYNNGLIILLGIILWITSLTISICFVVNYAKKVIDRKGSLFLSLEEQKIMRHRYDRGEDVIDEHTKLTFRQKITLVLFGLTFVIMILGFIPWQSFGITIFDNWSNILTGNPLGEWWFLDASLWFFLASLIIAIINRFTERETVDTFIAGASDMLSVVLIIAVARGVSVLMTTTHLDNYIIYNASRALSGMSPIIFTPLNYLLHIALSVLVPSSSGLATLSTPIMGSLANSIGYSVEVTIMTFVAANGLVNLITPTCGAIMGGLSLAGVNYSTWFKWAIKVVATIFIATLIILTVAAVLV